MIGVLQIAGAAAAVALFIVVYAITRSPWALAAGAAMTMHFVADALAKFFCFGGIKMSLGSLLNSFESNVKIKPFLTFVGLMLLDAVLVFTHSFAVKAVGYPAFGLGLAGCFYYQLYPKN